MTTIDKVREKEDIFLIDWNKEKISLQEVNLWSESNINTGHQANFDDQRERK